MTSKGGESAAHFFATDRGRENPCWFLPATLIPPSGLRSPGPRGRKPSSSSCTFPFTEEKGAVKRYIETQRWEHPGANFNIAAPSEP